MNEDLTIVTEPDAIEKPFREGEELYTITGDCVQFSAHHKGGYLAYPIFEVEEGNYKQADMPSYYKALYRNCPSVKKVENLKRLDEEIIKKREELIRLNKTIWDLNESMEQRATAIRAYQDLERLEDFISGKITHLVIEDGGDIKYCEFSQILDEDVSYGKGLKLLTLYGDSKGDLNWRLSQYSDGSGSSNIVYPCFSKEEAIEKTKEIIMLKVERIRRGDRYIINRVIESAEKINFELPADILLKHYEGIIAGINQSLQKQYKYIETDKKALLELQTKVDDIKQKLQPEELTSSPPLGGGGCQ